MNGNDIINLGYPKGEIIGIALQGVKKLKQSNYTDKDAKYRLQLILQKPEEWLDCPHFGELARHIQNHRTEEAKFKQLSKNCHEKFFEIYGYNGIQSEAIDQMKHAMQLPVVYSGALMPDAHLGYGVPIGAIIGVNNAVIPNAVGVDIGCRMKFSVLDVDTSMLDNHNKVSSTITHETKFGSGCEFNSPKNHKILDDPRWDETQKSKSLKDNARKQLGTSGSGNHFVTVGIITFHEKVGNLEKDKEYVALISHSGSRGPGAQIAKHYSDIAKNKLPKDFQRFKDLAWLDMDSEEGQEYWRMMNLMGDYSSANHEVIHDSISKSLKSRILHSIEHHHNFAWREWHCGKTLYVHRKGATPAKLNQHGIIPGSMLDNSYIVEGLGNALSLCSSSHGAGRKMSRSEAKNNLDWGKWKKYVKDQGVTLIGGAVDEVPGVYKSIDEVMSYQLTLASIIGTFKPRVVRMA